MDDFRRQGYLVVKMIPVLALNEPREKASSTIYFVMAILLTTWKIQEEARELSVIARTCLVDDPLVLVMEGSSFD